MSHTRICKMKYISMSVSLSWAFYSEVLYFDTDLIMLNLVTFIASVDLQVRTHVFDSHMGHILEVFKLPVHY